LEAIENVMEKRCSLGLFPSRSFLPLIPPLPLKSKRSLKAGSPASENHLAIVSLGWIQPQSPLGSDRHLLGLRGCILGKEVL
jgi:hypothetical protein